MTENAKLFVWQMVREAVEALGGTLPPLAFPHKNGRPKEYFTHDLLAVWPGFQDEGVDLPDLLPHGVRQRCCR